MTYDDHKFALTKAEYRDNLSLKLELDNRDYEDDLAELGVPADRANEFLQILWDIMGRFVRLGIDVEICERILEEGESDLAPGEKPLESTPTTTETEKPAGRKRDER